MSFDGNSYSASALGDLSAIATGMQLAQVYPMLEEISEQVAALSAELGKQRTHQPPSKSEFNGVGWLDAAGAQKYLSMSKNTFEKYAYNAEPKIPKYRVGGKNLFKATDLDLWVMTHEDKVLGLA